ncbi:MAG: single-stranded DNA-binding protein [Deltaproteobacteria bacterium]
MINKVILIGNLGKDPEVRKLENNNSVAKFSLATNENYQDKNGEWQKLTEWHNISMWGNLAERAEKYLHKGSTIFLEGKIKTRKYTDKNGIEKYITEIEAASFRILDKKDNDYQHSGIDSSDHVSQSGKSPDVTGHMETPDDLIDDLPF